MSVLSAIGAVNYKLGMKFHEFRESSDLQKFLQELICVELSKTSKTYKTFRENYQSTSL